MLYWNTVNDLLEESLRILMQSKEFKNFRLVGGTALSLHLGHRMSIDIDLFTDAPYGSIDFKVLEHFLKKSFVFVGGTFGDNPGMGKSYVIGLGGVDTVKLDLYYSMDPFFQEAIQEDGVRMASVDEISAMKIDVVQRGGRKKDFWDLHELLSIYSIRDMVDLHRQRFEWTHDEALILNNFIDFEKADKDLDPLCLRDKQWEFIKADIEEAIAGR